MRADTPPGFEVLPRQPRIREAVFVILSVASLCVSFSVSRRPDLEIAGLSGLPLLLTSLGVFVSCLVALLFLWRCPVCGYCVRLSRRYPICPRCDTLFVAPEEAHRTDPAVARGKAAERVVQAQSSAQWAQRSRDAVCGGALVILGLTEVGQAFLGPPAQPDGWLFRHFGQQGVTLGSLASGALVTVFGLFLIRSYNRARRGV